MMTYDEMVEAAGRAANAHVSDRAHTFDREATGWRVCRCGVIDKDGTHRTRMVLAAVGIEAPS